MLTASRTQPHGYDHRVEVMGTKSALSAGLTPRTPLTPVEGRAPGEARAEPYDGFVDRFAEAYAAEMAAFVALCRDEGPIRARSGRPSTRCGPSRRPGVPCGPDSGWNWPRACRRTALYEAAFDDTAQRPPW